MLVKNNFFLTLVQISFYFLPLSLIIGSLVVNINILIFLFLSLTYFINKKIPIKFNSTNITLFLFFLTIIISTLTHLDNLGIKIFLKSIFLLKFFLIYIVLETLILNDKINLRYFFNICLLLILFVSWDLLLQFTLGKNILGYKPWEGRITGIFEHEAIAGAYVQKIFIFALIGILVLFFSKKISNNFYQIIFFITVLFASFVASNRISFLILISLTIFIGIFYNVFRKNILISLFLLIPFFYLFSAFDSQISNKYQDFIIKVEKLGNQTSILQNENKTHKENSSLSNHGKIYRTTIISFKESKLIGNGLKSFRINCSKFLDQKNTLCSTHPHNYHLEVLHDSGILGFLLISLFVFLLIFSKYKKLRFSQLDNNNKIIITLLLLNLLVEIFPLKSTGSLFTTWNGTLLWVSISLVNYGGKKNLLNEKNTNS